MTRSVLCMPIVDDEGKLFGCLQAVNKVGSAGFTEDDARLLQTVASHISIFVECVMNGE